MIDGLYSGICNILRRDATVKYGGTAGHTYTVYKSDEPCLYIPKIGKSISVDASGNSIIVDCTFRMNEEIYITDRIQYKGYDYEVKLVQEKIDIITGTTQYYLAMAQRQREKYEENDSTKAIEIV